MDLRKTCTVYCDSIIVESYETRVNCRLLSLILFNVSTCSYIESSLAYHRNFYASERFSNIYVLVSLFATQAVVGLSNFVHLELHLIY